MQQKRKRAALQEDVRVVKPGIEKSKELPDEIWIQICSMLPVRSVAAFACTSHDNCDLVYCNVLQLIFTFIALTTPKGKSNYSNVLEGCVPPTMASIGQFAGS